jgi:signal transduction histidine kinase
VLELERRWVRPRPTSSQVRLDVLWSIVFSAVSVASVEIWSSMTPMSLGWKGVEGYLWLGVAGLALAGRRIYPLSTLLVESAIFIAVGERMTGLSAVFTIQMIMFASLYAAWAWSRDTRRLVVVSVAVLVAMFGWLVYIFATQDGPTGTVEGGLFTPYQAAVIYSLVINVVYFFGAIAWGHGAWRSARQRAAIAESAAAERAGQDRDRERAVQAERVRIARDLHDVVAHHVSGIGVQAAGAGRIIDARPDQAREALDVIERSSRQAVQQMHQLVGLLRADDDRTERGPQPGLGELGTLATPDTTPAVTFRQVGKPFDVPPTVGLSLFRIAQEAVANLRRHAHAAAGEVVLRFVPVDDTEPAAVEIEVIDDGDATDVPARPVASGGFGLTGIRERAAMHGGTCDIGPRPDGGFRVRVRIPVTP